MRRGVIKLLLSLVATAAAATSLVASTFAYVLINNKVVVPDFDFNIKGQEGLEISLDNKHWSKDILASQLKGSISNNFDDIKFGCTTIKMENAKIKTDENHQVLFTYDRVSENKDQTGKYLHEMVDATANADKGFIKFDLYLKAKSTYTEKSKYNLKVTDNTNITSTLANVTVNNDLRTKDMADYSQFKNYGPEEVVNVDIANAIRLGIYNVDEDADGKLSQYKNFNIYEITNQYDLGSVALESHKGLDDNYDPESNAMYTYYNSLFPRSPFKSGAQDGEAFETKTRENLLDTVFGEFNYNSAKDEYNVIKLEVYIWLEGWDADYFVGIPENTSISVDFEFEMNKINQ